MALVFQDQSGLGQGISKSSSAISQALQQRGAKNQQMSLIQTILNQNSQNKAGDGQQTPPINGQQTEIVEDSETIYDTQGNPIDTSGREQNAAPQFKVPYDESQLLAATMVNPELRKAMESQNNQAIESQKLQIKKQNQIGTEDRSEIREYAKPFQDVSKIKSSYNKLQKAKDLIVNKKVSLDQNQFRKLYTSALEDTGWDAVAELFKSDDQKKLFALLRDFFNPKEIGGSNPSTKEMLVTLSTIPSSNFGFEANLDLINTLLEDAEGKVHTAETIRDLRKSGREYNFGEFQEIVQKTSDKRLAPSKEKYKKEMFVAQKSKVFRGDKPKPGFVFVLDENGNPGSIPKAKIKDLEKKGGTVVNVY